VSVEEEEWVEETKGRKEEQRSEVGGAVRGEGFPSWKKSFRLMKGRAVHRGDIRLKPFSFCRFEALSKPRPTT